MEYSFSAQIVTKVKGWEGVESLSDEERETADCATAAHQIVTALN